MGYLKMAKTKTLSQNNKTKNSQKKKLQRIESKIGIKFPVSRLRRYLRSYKTSNVTRVSASAGVFIASTLEYLVAEIMEPAGEKAKEDKRTRVKPRHILLSIKADEELSQIMKGQFPREA